MNAEESGWLRENVITYLKGELEGEALELFERALASDPDLRAEIQRAREVMDVLEAASEGKVVRLVRDTIQEAIRRGASDIHLVPGRQDLVTWLRVDGRLEEVDVSPFLPGERRVPHWMRSPVLNQWKQISECSLREKQHPQHGRATVHCDGREYLLYVATLPTFFGERLTVRIIDPGRCAADLERIGLGGPRLEAVRRLLRRPNGFIPVAGPHASGKTNILYAMLRDLLSPGEPLHNIMTVEDPVEQPVEGISQTSVDLRAGLTFASALRHLFRGSDPDVVMAGDLPDPETVDVALHIAATGHLIFSQLPASGAVDAISRLRNMGADRVTLAQTLAGVIGVRLIRRVCDDCAAPYEAPAEQLAPLGLTPSDGPFRRGTGCEACHWTGYRRRLSLFEVLEADEPLRRLIVEDARPELLQEAAFPSGRGSLLEDARERVRAGVTTPEEALRALRDYPGVSG